MKYKNHRSEPYFTFLKNGQKTIEGRIRKEKYAEIKVGDFIDVYNNEESSLVEVKVKRITNYKSFKEMLSLEPIQKVLPDVETVDEGVLVYRKFYLEKEEQKYGVVAIEVIRI